MKSIAFFNNKGGVGKTTLLCNVAAYASLHLNKRVAVIDSDPQCNATQYIFDDESLEKIYGDNGFTINDIIEPLSLGEGFFHNLQMKPSNTFGFDVLPGDPKLALMEDFLAQDWSAAKSGNVRGMKTNLVFSDLFSRLHQYDLVFIDVSPSLGAINRSILLASDYFVSPMSIDIFSLKAFENIAQWITNWWDEWQAGVRIIKGNREPPQLSYGEAIFVGYVTQQYLAKRDSAGNRRGVKAYEEIRKDIDNVIRNCGLDKGIPKQPFEIGTVPNLFSLVPMSQSNNKPIFELKSSDGVVGAHFAKVKDAEDIFADVTKNLLERING